MTLTVYGPHIQACGYRKGREFVQRPSVNLIGVHSAEGATDEIGLGNYFKDHCRGSSNCGIGQDGGFATYVNWADTSWTNPPLSQESDTIELCGFAAWTRTQWLAKPAMLETLAKVLAWRCAVRRIPIRLLTADQVAAGYAGIADHFTINVAYDFGYSDHWDIGKNYPWDVTIPRAKQIAGVGGSTPPATTYYTVQSGDTLSSIAAKFKTTVETLVRINGLTDPDSISVGQRLKVPATQTGVLGKFPYASDHYFYLPSASNKCHSGYWPVDRPYVRMIQYEVKVPQTGYYDRSTKYWVAEWQEKRGLRRDGVVGPYTWARMAAS